MFLYPVTKSSLAENDIAIQNSNIIKVRAKVMPFIVDVQEAREQVAALHNERIAENLDAENVQENDECNQLGPEIHPDFETQHPDYFEGPKEPRNTTSAYKKLHCWMKKKFAVKCKSLIPIKGTLLMCT